MMLPSLTGLVAVLASTTAVMALPAENPLEARALGPCQRNPAYKSVTSLKASGYCTSYLGYKTKTVTKTKKVAGPTSTIKKTITKTSSKAGKTVKATAVATVKKTVTKSVQAKPTTRTSHPTVFRTANAQAHKTATKTQTTTVTSYELLNKRAPEPTVFSVDYIPEDEEDFDDDEVVEVEERDLEERDFSEIDERDIFARATNAQVKSKLSKFSKAQVSSACKCYVKPPKTKTVTKTVKTAGPKVTRTSTKKVTVTGKPKTVKTTVRKTAVGTKTVNVKGKLVTKTVPTTVTKTVTKTTTDATRTATATSVVKAAPIFRLTNQEDDVKCIESGGTSSTIPSTFNTNAKKFQYCAAICANTAGCETILIYTANSNGAQCVTYDKQTNPIDPGLLGNIGLKERRQLGGIGGIVDGITGGGDNNNDNGGNDGLGGIVDGITGGGDNNNNNGGNDGLGGIVDGITGGGDNNDGGLVGSIGDTIGDVGNDIGDTIGDVGDGVGLQCLTGSDGTNGIVYQRTN